MIPTNILLCSLISLVFSVAIPQEDTNELLQDLDRRDPAVACSWPRHCLGAPCLTSDDCSDILVCTQFFCSEPSLVTSVSVVTSRAITITSTVATRPSSPSVTPSDPSSSDKAPSPEPTSNYNVIFGPMNTNEITHFDDDVYQCYEWNYRAKSAIAKGYRFAASNYRLVSPNLAAPFKLKCGGPQYLCGLGVQDGLEYIIIDWCDPNNLCGYSEKNHLDILVGREASSGNECAKVCEPYQTFIKNTSWELIECSFQINAEDFPEQSGTSDGAL